MYIHMVLTLWSMYADPTTTNCPRAPRPETLRVSVNSEYAQCQAGTGGDVIDDVSDLVTSKINISLS